MVRVSSGSAMRSGATLRKYGGGRDAGVNRRPTTRRVDSRPSQTTRSTRSFAGNTRGGNAIRARPNQTTHRFQDSGKIRSVTHRSNKSGSLRTMNVKDRDAGIKSDVIMRQSKTGYKAHVNSEDKDGLKYSYKYNVNLQKPKTTTVSKATSKGRQVSKTKQVVARKQKGSVGAVKGSGIKSIKFKSITRKLKGSKVGKGLTTLSKTRRGRKPKTVTKMGPRGTVKSRKVLGGSRRKVKQLY